MQISLSCQPERRVMNWNQDFARSLFSLMLLVQRAVSTYPKPLNKPGDACLVSNRPLYPVKNSALQILCLVIYIKVWSVLFRGVEAVKAKLIMSPSVVFCTQCM